MFEIYHDHNKEICISSLRKNTPDIEIPSNNSFEFGQMLEFQYHLLEHVFQFLEAKDLHTASLINPIWDKAAKWELQKRSSATWISCSCIPRLPCNVHTSQGFNYNNTAICIIAYCPKTIKLEKYICLHDTEIERITFAEYIQKEVVPHKADYCTISCTHLSSSNIRMENVKLLYQGICIPFIPNIRTTMFNCSPKKKDQLSNFIKDNEQVRCVLVFTQRYRVNVAEFFLGALLKGQNPKNVAMGGGLIKSTKLYQQNNLQRLFRTEDLFCIAFLEQEGAKADFNAYSTVIISEDDGTPDNYKQFETELLKLKEGSILRKNGVIFRFCCFAKEQLPKIRETTIIEKHFPNYPLLGMEVDGEIGWNSANIQEEESDDTPEVMSKKFKAEVPQSLHGWSTVLVLITWGKKL